MSCRINAIHGGRSTVPYRRGIGSCRLVMSGSSAARTRASCRCSPGVSGLACADTAFTKYRAPLAHRTRAARPGLNRPAGSGPGRRRRRIRPQSPPAPERGSAPTRRGRPAQRDRSYRRPSRLARLRATGRQRLRANRGLHKGAGRRTRSATGRRGKGRLTKTSRTSIDGWPAPDCRAAP